MKAKGPFPMMERERESARHECSTLCSVVKILKHFRFEPGVMRWQRYRSEEEQNGG
jgi:hypothetical protein